MSEFFLELFSEEIPAGLQKNLREKLLKDFQNFFEKKLVKSKKSFSLSTPNRLVIVFEGLVKQVKIKSEEIKGPKIESPYQALEGFIKSNKIEKKDLYKNKTEKGEFFFYKTKSKTLKTHDLLTESIPKILESYQWKKSMKWGEFNLDWGRPLKSILSVFDKKVINFKFHHLISSNSTFVNKDLEDKKKIFLNFKIYEKFFKKQGIVINQNKRLKIIGDDHTAKKMLRLPVWPKVLIMPERKWNKTPIIIPVIILTTFFFIRSFLSDKKQPNSTIAMSING